MPRVKIVKQTTILYTTKTLKRKVECKNIDTVKTKLLSSKHKNGNTNTNEKRGKRDNTKMHKMPWHNVKNNYFMKLKHLRRNKPFEIQVEPSPRATGKLVNNKKHFTMKFKNESIKHVCIVKLLHKLD